MGPVETRQGKWIVFVTADQVDIHLQLASFGDRCIAFLADVMVIVLTTVLSVLLAFYLSVFTPEFEWLFVSLLQIFIAFFFIFYFIFLERRRGATWGKSLLKLKVVSASGGFLPLRAIYTRNLFRLVEVWIPFFLLLEISQSPPTANVGRLWIAFFWFLPLTLVPLFDSKNRRLGDILAGTLVVYVPELGFHKDLLEEKSWKKRKKSTSKLLASEEESSQKSSEEDGEEEFRFTAEMLDTYGQRELEVLENLLRHIPEMSLEAKRDLLPQLVEKISRKIGYSQPIRPHQYEAFLFAFYKAHRKYLEERLVRGRSLERKSRRHGPPLKP